MRCILWTTLISTVLGGDMNQKRHLAFVGLVACFAITANAITITETADYPGGVSLSDPNVGTLDSGANTVSGSLNGSCNVGDCNPGDGLHGDTQDSFLVTVPTGYQITSLTVTTSSVSGPMNFSASFELRNSSLTVVQSTPFLSPLNGTTANLLSAPASSGTYVISVFGQQANAAGAYSLNWTVTMNLAPNVVLPSDAITSLINLINNPYSGLVLTQGQTNSLTDKLNNALTSLLAGQNKQAINQLNSFVNSVQTYLKNGKISAQDANTLIVAATAIITSLQ